MLISRVRELSSSSERWVAFEEHAPQILEALDTMFWNGFLQLLRPLNTQEWANVLWRPLTQRRENWHGWIAGVELRSECGNFTVHWDFCQSPLQALVVYIYYDGPLEIVRRQQPLWAQGLQPACGGGAAGAAGGGAAPAEQPPVPLPPATAPQGDDSSDDSEELGVEYYTRVAWHANAGPAPPPPPPAPPSPAPPPSLRLAPFAGRQMPAPSLRLAPSQASGDLQDRWQARELRGRLHETRHDGPLDAADSALMQEWHTAAMDDRAYTRQHEVELALLDLWHQYFQPVDGHGGLRAADYDFELYHDDDPSFIVLTETKFSFRCIPVWDRYSPHRTRVEKKKKHM
jgi:hypothetical protein